MHPEGVILDSIQDPFYNPDMKFQFVPKDTLYTPLTQQKWLCTATCIQMVMARHNIPLVPAEEIAGRMGLLVPAGDLKYFWKASTGEKPNSGWGTRVGKPQYTPNAVFKKFGIPLKMSWTLINKLKTYDQFLEYLKNIGDRDVLICFDWGSLYGRDHHGGHICVLDKVDLKKGEVRMIDPEPEASKWQTVKMASLYEAMKYHGHKNSGGFWELTVQ